MTGKLGFAAKLALAAVMVWTMEPVPLAAATQQETARDAAFAQMFAAPTNRAAMLAYARASLDLRDFEAAIATLERLVALEPDNTEARHQLALAYFALGSNAISEQKLRALATSDDAQTASRAAPYLRAASSRAAPSAISGAASIGGTAASRASDRALDAAITLTWRQDMGTAGTAQWLTDLAASTRRYHDQSGQPSDNSVTLRSGPQWRIGPDAEGPVVQPYLLVTAARDIIDAEEVRYGAGGMLQARLGQRGGLTADLAFGTLDTRTDGRGQFTDIALGGSYRLGDATIARLRLSQQQDRGLTSANQTAQQAKLDLWHSFRPAFSTLARDWRVGTMVQHGTITSDSRDYQETTASVMGRMWVTQQGYLDAALGQSRQDEGAPNVAQRSNWLSLRLGWEF